MNTTAVRAAEFLGFGMLGSAGELLQWEETISSPLSDDAPSLTSYPRQKRKTKPGGKLKRLHLPDQNTATRVTSQERQLAEFGRPY